MVALAFAVPLGLLVRTVAIERTLSEVEVGARALAPVLAGVAAPGDLEAVVTVAATRVPGTLTIHLPDGSRIGPEVVRDAHLEDALGGQASRSRTSDGWRVLVPVLRPDGPAVVDVAVPGATARAGVGRAWAMLAVLAGALVAGAVLVADRLARTTVTAVRELGAVAEQLGRGELAARAEVTEPPEVAAVAASLHALAGRISRLLATERETAADLSHRLRTPLMALRLDLESLPPSPTGTRLAEDLDLLERAVDAAITDARRVAEDRVPVVIDLVELLRARAAFWRVLAEDQGRRFDLDLPASPVVVDGDPEELSSAVDALLGNVFAHTQEGAGFSLRLVHDGGTHAIVVDDDGPGLPDDALVLTRGVSRAGSTGLGLDIARRAVEPLGGQLRWGRSSSGGASISLVIPGARSVPESSERP